MKVWIYIIAAAFFQMLWGISLKHLDFSMIISLLKNGEFYNPKLIAQIVPLLAYFLLGLVIVIVISRAYKLLPMSIVYAAWMGLTLLFQVLVDALYYGEKMAWTQYLFILLILIGVIGMKQSQKKDIIENESDLLHEIMEETK